MMDTEQVALLDVVGHMLADGAYVMADPDPDPRPVCGLRVFVRFGGARRGAMILDADEAVGLEMATNLAGVDEAPSAALASEALRELANMITGAALPRLFGSEPVFELGIPSPAEAIDGSSPAPTCAHEVALVSDEGHAIHVRLVLEDHEEGAS